MLVSTLIDASGISFGRPLHRLARLPDGLGLRCEMGQLVGLLACQGGEPRLTSRYFPHPVFLPPFLRSYPALPFRCLLQEREATDRERSS